MDLNSILYAGYLTVAVFGQTIPGSREVVRQAGLQAIHADGNLSLRIVEDGRSESREGLSTHVCTTYRDESYPFFITRHVVRWDDCGVVETWLDVRHDEPAPVRLVRMDSLAAAIPGSPAKVRVLTLAGANQHEAGVVESELSAGQTIATSSREGIHNAWESNPVMMISFGDSSESAGEVLGVALEWTGCSAKSVRREFNGATKVFIGVDNQGGPYVLDPGVTLTTPRAMLVLSHAGKGEVSRQFHRWAHLHLMPHGYDLHPVLLNSWEGSY
ncbi:MAG: alpha-galactosidase, partial [bacterium]|nr:alpha-galactosidase [Candidatus Colisoma equi]